MKRQKTLLRALPKAQKENEKIERNLEAIRKAIEQIVKINEENSWMNYTGSAFLEGASEAESIEYYKLTRHISGLDRVRDIVAEAFANDAE